MQTPVKWLVCTALLAVTAFAADNNFYLHAGDTVVFYGDSITDQRLYTMVTELYAVTRYPRMGVHFVHSGWGGDEVSGGGGGPIDLRLQRDVFAYKPTVMTIMLGMNDGKYANHQASDDDVYYNGYRHIVDQVKDAVKGIRITAIEPSPYDEATRPITILAPTGYNAVLVNYGKWIRRFAQESGLKVADLNTGVVQMLAKASATDAATAQKIIPDRVHPALGGHMIMAEQLLKSWNARPIVSSVEIDGASGKVKHTAFADVTNVTATPALSWTELDESLPLPFADILSQLDENHTIALAIQSSDITKALNDETLRVTGLAPRQYVLKIDGESVGTFSNTALAEGIDLASMETPMSRQAFEVYKLTVERLDIHNTRWRTIQVPLADVDVPHLQPALSALDDLDADVTARQHSMSQPKAHKFELTPAT
jgi:lysophospholipase L1-like esterase